LEYKKNRKLDVEYDDKAFGQLIDPYQWNQNFKKIEEVVNQNIETMEGNLDNIVDGNIPSAAIEELDQTERSDVRSQLIAIVTMLLKKSDMSVVEDLLKQCIQISRLTTTSQTLPPGEKVQVTHSFNKDGYLNLDFAIPQGSDGTLIDLENGIFALQINSQGHLMVLYNDGTSAPDMYINEDGHLIYEFE